MFPLYTWQFFVAVTQAVYRCRSWHATDVIVLITALMHSIDPAICLLLHPSDTTGLNNYFAIFCDISLQWTHYKHPPERSHYRSFTDALKREGLLDSAPKTETDMFYSLNFAHSHPFTVATHKVIIIFFHSRSYEPLFTFFRLRVAHKSLIVCHALVNSLFWWKRCCWRFWYFSTGELL